MKCVEPRHSYSDTRDVIVRCEWRRTEATEGDASTDAHAASVRCYSEQVAFLSPVRGRLSRLSVLTVSVVDSQTGIVYGDNWQLAEEDDAYGRQTSVFDAQMEQAMIDLEIVDIAESDGTVFSLDFMEPLQVNQ